MKELAGNSCQTLDLKRFYNRMSIQPCAQTDALQIILQNCLLYPSHKSLYTRYTAHQQFQLVNYVQAHQMFTIDLGTLSFYMTT